MEKEEQEIQRLRQMADRLDCFIEEDFLALSLYTEGTARELRKRGQGPAFTRIGKRILYPKQAVADFLASQVRTPRSNLLGGAL